MSRAGQNLNKGIKIGNVWVIHGKKYDLTQFIEKHPGGKQVIERASYMEDAGVMFEIYHAFSNKESIKAQLSKYLISDENIETSTKDSVSSSSQLQHSDLNTKTPVYDFQEFEEILTEVKTLFPTRLSIKANWFWYLKSLFLTLLYLYTFYIGIFSESSLFLRCLCCFFAGALWIMVGFNVMHDGSHYGISKYPKVNETLEMIWNSFGLWNSLIWHLHHSYGHHSFTGDENYDPDMKHYRPFAVKYKGDRSKVFKASKLYQDKIITFIATILPGMYIGQMISYIFAAFKGKLWGVSLPKNLLKTLTWTELVLMLLGVLCALKGFFLPYFFYSISQNIFYHLNIAPDHDTFESSVQNKEQGNTANWVKMQIHHTGNFSLSNMLWTHLFGGINYQIEHHLFPNMSHVHYPTTSPIVQKFCKKKGYDYVAHSTLWSAYSSFLKMMKHQVSTQD